MKQVIVQYDGTNIYDMSGGLITGVSGLVYKEVKPEGLTVDDIIKLKASGFSAEEILVLKSNGVES